MYVQLRGDIMFKITMSIIMIGLGIVLILLGIYDTRKQLTKMNIQNKSIVNKYLKYEKVLNVITGFSCVIAGVLSILNLLTGEQVGLLVSFIMLIDRILEFVFSKKYKILNR